jgi:hypothetical protein
MEMVEYIQNVYNQGKTSSERKSFTSRQIMQILSPTYIMRARQSVTRPLVTQLIRDVDFEIGTQTEREVASRGYRLDGHVRSGGIGQIRKGYEILTCKPVAAKVNCYIYINYK